MNYLGIEFGNYDEMNEWNKNGHITEYRKLAEMFSHYPSEELSSIMSDRATVLVESFGLTWTEIEALEIA